MGDINLDDMVNAIIEVRNKMIKKKIVEELGVQIVALRAELAGVIEGHKAATELTEKIDLAKDRMIAARDAEIAALRAQVAELQAWKDAVPVVGIKRLFRDAPYDASYADEVWQCIEKYTLNR